MADKKKLERATKKTERRNLNRQLDITGLANNFKNPAFRKNTIKKKKNMKESWQRWSWERRQAIRSGLGRMLAPN